MWPFKSRDEREREKRLANAHREIDTIASMVDQQVGFVEGVLTKKQAWEIAMTVFTYVIETDRTREGLAAITARAKAFAETNPEYATSLTLPMLLVNAGLIAREFHPGPEWLPLSLKLTAIEAKLVGFLERQGVAPWTERYALEEAFDAYRAPIVAAWREQARREEAARPPSGPR